MRWRSLLTVALVAGLAAPPLMGQDSRPGIAVLPFENGGSYGQDREDFDALQVGLQQMLITELAVNNQLRVVERGRIRDLLAEQELGASGKVDPQTAAQIGKIVGARYVVLGGFVDFYGDFRIDLRIVNVETSELVKTERMRDKRENLYDMVVGIANQTTRGLNLPALSRQAFERREGRDVPEEAVRLYSKALLFQERGDTDRAAELFSQVVSRFPQYTEAQEQLQQLRQG